MKSLSSISDFFKILNKGEINFSSLENHYKPFNDTNPKIITVSKPSLPPLSEFIPFLENIWSSGFVTNDGPYHKIFEKELCRYLNVKNVSLVSNGTLSLLLALKAHNLKGSIITTPYSFIATTNAIDWNAIRPIFCDVDPLTLNICPDKLENLIEKDTTAILATNVYGYPCDFKSIHSIANKNNLKVIYDSAHSFAVKEGSESILNNGDASILSFHGTKVFTTFEGGAIISKSSSIKKEIDMLKNFAIENEVSVKGKGINAKMNEFQAALGVLQLRYIDKWIEKRKILYEKYFELLSNVEGIKLHKFPKNIKNNFSYFPIFVNRKSFRMSRDELYLKLKENNIISRRYFYPIISEFPLFKSLPSSNKKNLKNAFKISREVICLPLHTNLTIDEVYKICYIIKKAKALK